MRDSLNCLCEAFIANRDVLRRSFKFESNYIYSVCANIFCALQTEAKAEELSACRKLLIDRTGLFSNFRGTLKLPVISMLAAGKHPEAMMDQALDNYAMLKKEFYGSQYLALTAFILENLGVRSAISERIFRGKALYQRMKKEHRFLTSAEDSVFAVLLSFSELSDDALAEDMETCFKLVKNRLGGGNAAQSVSHILAMTSGIPEEKTERLFAIYDGLHERGRKYGKHYELSTLAAVSVLDGDIDQIVQDILDADAYLSEQKGYGVLRLDKKTRLMHAAMLTADDYCLQSVSFADWRQETLHQNAANSAVITSTLAMLAAQQAAMCAVMISSTAAPTAASIN